MWYLLTLIDVLVIALGFALVTVSPWFLPLSLLIVGTGQHRLALMAHDAAHGHADKFSRRLIFALLGIGLDGYWGFHGPHHRYTHIPLLDPELRFKAHHPYQWAEIPTSAEKLEYFIKDCLGLGADNIIYMIRMMWEEATYADLFFVGGLWGIILFLVSLTGTWLYLGLYLLAIFTTFWAMFRQRAFTEHVGVIRDIQHTRKYKSKWWERWSFEGHNSDHHLEHHQHPNVPSWELPQWRKNA